LSGLEDIDNAHWLQ